MSRKVLRRRLADMPDAEREDEARERRVLALFDAGDDVRRALLRHPLQRRELRDAQPIQIGRRAHQLRVDELVDELVAQALDVHRAAAREMQQRLLALRGADQSAGAARDRLAFESQHRRPAFGALRRHDERLRILRPALGQHTNDFGDHVAGAAHDDGIADVHVLATHLVLVVQRGVDDGDAADEHRLQPRHRRDRAGAADLHVDADDFGRHLLGGELVREREARCARDVAELALRGEVVDLVDDAVDVVRQLRAPRADAPVIARAGRRGPRRPRAPASPENATRRAGRGARRAWTGAAVVPSRPRRRRTRRT